MRAVTINFVETPISRFLFIYQSGVEFSDESNELVFNAVSLISFMQIMLKTPFLTIEYFRHCRGIYQAKIKYHIKF